MLTDGAVMLQTARAKQEELSMFHPELLGEGKSVGAARLPIAVRTWSWALFIKSTAMPGEGVS